MSDSEAILARLPHHRSVLERNLQIVLRMVDGMDEAAADHAPAVGGRCCTAVRPDSTA